MPLRKDWAVENMANARNLKGIMVHVLICSDIEM